MVVLTTTLALLGGGVGVGPQQVEAATHPKDVEKVSPGEKAALLALYDKNLIGGYSDGTFRPTKVVTRAEFASMLVRALGLKSNGDNYNFADSNYSKWYHSVLNVAYQYKLLGGKGVDAYGRPIMSPNAPISRVEMMAILVRTNSMFQTMTTPTQVQTDATLNAYADGKNVPKWARDVVAQAIQNKITSGVSTTHIGHGDTGNRLQSAVFAHRMLSKKDASGIGIALPSHKEGVAGPQVAIKYPDGYTYVGEVNGENVENGWGLIYFPTGEVFADAYFENGQFNGKGTLYYEDGLQMYKGDFVDDEMEGQGVFVGEKNEFRYEGTFVNDLYEGQGKYYLNGELLYEGSFSNDVFHGQGKYYEGGKLFYQGAFLNDDFHGYGTVFDVSGNIVYQGMFAAGVPVEGQQASLNSIVEEMPNIEELKE